MPFRVRCLLLAAISVFAFSCADPGGAQKRVIIQGAGATFPSPLYQKWFADYQAAHPDVRIEYQPMGSGAGIQLFTPGRVNFGASDAAMTDEQMAQVTDGGVQLLPLAGGAVVLAYNVPGVPDGLRLSRDAYAGIFQGSITSWDDPKIAEPNSGVALPKTPITVVRRLGSSGTTFVFTQHLSAVSESWKNGPGTGLSVRWPTGVGAKGGDGIADTIRQTPGAIGYLNQGGAQENKLAVASLQNRSGEYVRPTLEAEQATLATVSLGENLRGWSSDPEGKECYPIVSFTWLLVHRKYEDTRVAAALKDVCNYALTDGQKDCAPLGYVPLPPPVAERVRHAADAIGQ
jgi:phosphate transport system substrate-binding protein